MEKTLEHLTAEYEHNQRRRMVPQFIRAALLTAIHGGTMADHLAKGRRDQYFEKTVVPALTTGDLGPLTIASRDWVRSLPTILMRMSDATVPAPLLTQVPTAASDPTPVWVGEGQPAPMALLEPSGPNTTASKFIFLRAFSKEFGRLEEGRALALIDPISRRDVTKIEDALLLSTDPEVAGVSSAGLLRGLSPVGGGSPSSLADDITALWSSVRGGNPDRPYFILSPRGAMYLASLHEDGAPLFPHIGPLGGSIFTVPAIVSPAAGDRLILVDAAELAVTDGGLTVEPAYEAAVQLTDSPVNGPATLVSAFQTNSVVVRYVRYLSWVLLANDAVAFIELPIGA